jgi:hypothetical protein
VTITATPSEIAYSTTGGIASYAIPFPFDTSADLKVTLTDSSGNISIITTGFTITGGGGSTGTITPSPVFADSQTLTILDNPVLTQPTDYTDNDAFPADSHEKALDRLTRICKRLYQQVQRSIRTSDGDPITDNTLGSVENRKGKYLFFNAITGAIEYAVSIVTTTLSRSIIGQLLYPQTQSEEAVSAPIINPHLKPGLVMRYSNTLDSAALQIALNANAGMAVYLMNGQTQVLTTAVTIPANTDIYVEDGGYAVIDASGATLAGSGLITAIGALGSSLGGGIAIAVSKGATSVTLNSAPTLSPGDLLVLRNATNASWNGDNASYRQGEFLTVKSVSGAVVTFASSTFDSYSTSCTLHKVTYTTTKIKGNITINGNVADTSNIPTVYIQYGYGTEVQGVKFRNTTSSCLELNDCYDFKIQIDTGKYLTDAGAIQASGVIACGQNGSIHDSILHSARHGASTGGGGRTVSRNVYFERCEISSTQAAAADFHGSAEYCGYRYCRISGNVNLSGDNNEVTDCTIQTASGPLINMDACLGIAHRVQRNKFYVRAASQYVLDASASTDINANTTRSGTLLFDDNDIFDESSADQSYVFVRNNGSSANLRVQNTNNRYSKTDSTKYGNTLSMSVVSGANFQRLQYGGNVHFGTGFGLVSGVDAIALSGSLGQNSVASSSPSFGSTRFEPSEFTVQKTISVGTAGTVFTLFNPDTATFLPTMITGRCDTDVTATNGNYIGIGVNAANRRVDFGTFTAVAASSKHAKNDKILWMNSSELANQVVVSGEVLAVMSVDVNTDAAVLASNMGGATQTMTFIFAGRILNTIVSAP